MKKFVIIGIISVAVIGICYAYLIFVGQLRFNYPDKDEFPIVGIDISHHQGKMNWAALRTEDISFVIIKATEGVDYKDPRFNTNWTMSKQQGYKTGAYHFYRICKNGKEQAANFIATVPNEDNNLPPTIDLEFGGNCKTDKSKAQILEEVNEFLQILESHYNKKPIIYVTHEFYDDYLVDEFTEYPIWIRDIFKRPVLRDKRDWLIWQFANRAHLNGIDMYVDLNVLNGKSIDVLQ
ncbi:glycoside hydrolase family 25 protein [Pseudochryseolinea flava]|uniref:Lysozyme n=1 Tax=Pseudochryseolinea flava TaxID=2059302 RepID=A0A364XXE4_9BACT|nr:GH25 family lysozyme [Pseudochryseolinea flava]RAV98440.1 lysozyme [Pseudochryseolinea flava]